jgi:glycosyltransferase involved in cell wall biosynthesis
VTDFLFLWPGLPDYAARLIRGVIDAGFEVDVLATKPSVPIEGMERSLGQRVIWIEPDSDVSFRELGLALPKLVFQGGYHIKSIERIGCEARSNQIGVVLMADNNWTVAFRQRFVDPIRHRFLHVSRFDGVLVPGASGKKWARRMGYSGPLAMGMYGADPGTFYPGLALSSRPKRLVFVGQFVPRKNVVGLTDAFAEIADQFPDWTLTVCGAGDQRSELRPHPAINVEGFLQPQQLANKLRGARALVLPSLEEHWGLVVHEATLSGMALLLSDVVGAASDLATAKNSVLFKPGDKNAMKMALQTIMAWTEAEWHAAEAASLDLASKFGPRKFVAGVLGLAEQIVGQESFRIKIGANVS